jgi:hypothetical protein
MFKKYCRKNYKDIQQSFKIITSAVLSDTFSLVIGTVLKTSLSLVTTNVYNNYSGAKEY